MEDREVALLYLLNRMHSPQTSSEATMVGLSPLCCRYGSLKMF
jgi:hypothetical protein